MSDIFFGTCRREIGSPRLQVIGRLQDCQRLGALGIGHPERLVFGERQDISLLLLRTHLCELRLPGRGVAIGDALGDLSDGGWVVFGVLLLDFCNGRVRQRRLPSPLGALGPTSRQSLLIGDLAAHIGGAHRCIKLGLGRVLSQHRLADGITLGRVGLKLLQHNLVF